jgi:hypothetical protein
MIFCKVNTQFEEEREEKEREKRKTISGQYTLNHHTYTT